MATKTYNLTEATKLLVGGKCKGIHPAGDDNYVVLGINGGLAWRGLEVNDGIYLPTDYVLGEWTLEEAQSTVILSGFLNIYDDDVCFHATEEIADRCSNDRRIACIPFSYSTPFEG